MSHAHCCKNKLNSSVSQNLDELEFERGLWSAAYDGDRDRVEKLLHKCANHPDITDAAGYTALHYAASRGHKHICELLLDAGANIDAETRAGKATALHRASSNGKKDIVELLLKKGSSVTKQDADGRTALHRAIINKHLEIAGPLSTQYPETLSVKDNKGKTPTEYY